MNGYLHALDALTGRLLGSNDLPGFGTGVASLASVRGGSSQPMPAFAASEDAQNAAMANSQSATTG